MATYAELYHFLYFGLNFDCLQTFQIRDATGARVMFPNEGDANPNLITIMGKKEGVVEAKKQLLDVNED